MALKEGHGLRIAGLLYGWLEGHPLRTSRDRPRHGCKGEKSQYESNADSEVYIWGAKLVGCGLEDRNGSVEPWIVRYVLSVSLIIAPQSKPGNGQVGYVIVFF